MSLDLTTWIQMVFKNWVVSTQWNLRVERDLEMVRVNLYSVQMRYQRAWSVVTELEKLGWFPNLVT